MDTVRFGLGLRALRRHKRLTQRELARRAGVSRPVIGRIERGQADRVALHTLSRVAAVLGARIDLRLLWQGEGLDRLLDAGHARLVERVVSMLAANGWVASSEVSFNIRGERGSIDVLAFHPGTSSLLVVEVKSVVPDLQAMLVTLDRKGRLGREIARERGWDAGSVTRLLILPNDRTARRRLDAHAATIGATLPAATVDVRRWLQAPIGTMHGVMFVTDDPQASTRHRVSTGRPIAGQKARSPAPRVAPRS
jgi:transcriptional regulator with XRE-family HTH domain